jgi:hypothetical protein
MKSLSVGMVLVAALAISAPVSAQTSTPQPAATPEPSAPNSAVAPQHRHARPHHYAAHGGTHMHHSSKGSTANRLNQQELARLQAGSSMPPPPASVPPSGTRLEGPRPSSGR